MDENTQTTDDIAQNFNLYSESDIISTNFTQNNITGCVNTNTNYCDTNTSATNFSPNSINHHLFEQLETQVEENSPDLDTMDDNQDQMNDSNLTQSERIATIRPMALEQLNSLSTDDKLTSTDGGSSIAQPQASNRFSKEEEGEIEILEMESQENEPPEEKIEISQSDQAQISKLSQENDSNYIEDDIPAEIEENPSIQEISLPNNNNNTMSDFAIINETTNESIQVIDESLENNNENDNNQSPSPEPEQNSDVQISLNVKKSPEINLNNILPKAKLSPSQNLLQSNSNQNNNNQNVNFPYNYLNGYFTTESNLPTLPNSGNLNNLEINSQISQLTQETSQTNQEIESTINEEILKNAPKITYNSYFPQDSSPKNQLSKNNNHQETSAQKSPIEILPKCPAEDSSSNSSLQDPLMDDLTDKYFAANFGAKYKLHNNNNRENAPDNLISQQHQHQFNLLTTTTVNHKIMEDENNTNNNNLTSPISQQQTINNNGLSGNINTACSSNSATDKNSSKGQVVFENTDNLQNLMKQDDVVAARAIQISGNGKSTPSYSNNIENNSNSHTPLIQKTSDHSNHQILPEVPKNNNQALSHQLSNQVGRQAPPPTKQNSHDISEIQISRNHNLEPQSQSYDLIHNNNGPESVQAIYHQTSGKIYSEVKTFTNTYNSVPKMKKGMLICCQVIAVVLIMVSWIAGIFSFTTNDWMMSSWIGDEENKEQITVGMWKIAYVNGIERFTKYSTFNGVFPIMKPEKYDNLPKSIFIGRIFMFSAISLSISGFLLAILGCSFSCCNKSWILTCTIQTFTCIFLGLASCAYCLMAIVFPLLFWDDVDDGKMDGLPAFSAVVQGLEEKLFEGSVVSVKELGFKYGLSLYLCWASMCLSGVATAIYAFSTCLFCAEFKLARRKNLICERSRYFNQSNYQSGNSEEKNKLLKDSQSNRSQSAVVSKSNENANKNNNNNYNLKKSKTAPFKYRIGSDAPLKEDKSSKTAENKKAPAQIISRSHNNSGTTNPNNFPPTLGNSQSNGNLIDNNNNNPSLHTSSKTMPNFNRRNQKPPSFGGYGAVVTYQNSPQYEAVQDQVAIDHLPGNYRHLQVETNGREKKQSVV